MTLTTIDLGNRERVSRGVVPELDGTFTALDLSASKAGFKSAMGAHMWLARRAAKRDGFDLAIRLLERRIDEAQREAEIAGKLERDAKRAGVAELSCMLAAYYRARRELQP